MTRLKGSGYEKILLLFFCSGAFIFYGFFYSAHIYQKEQFQIFQTTLPYLLLKISVHGGAADYLGELLVQFFGLPFAGAAIISGLLALLVILTREIIRVISGSEPLMILTFIPAAGYFIILQNDFYSLSGLAGLILALAFSLLYLKIQKPAIRAITGIILIPVVYWFTGAAYISLTLIIFASEIILITREKDIKPVPGIALAGYLFLAIFAPLAGRWLIFEDTILQAYISESYYRLRIFFPLPLILILISFPLFILLQEFLFASFGIKPLRPLRLNIVSFIIITLFLITGVLFYGDFEAEKRLAYDNLVYHEEWDKIIEKAEKEQPADQLSMVAVNLALAKTGRMSGEMFSFKQEENSLFPVYERRGTTPFIAGEPFYHLGLVNFAQMFATETLESTPDVRYPSRSFIRIASTYIINGQYDIALKYLNPLNHTIFYRRWAEECISLLYDEVRINAHPYWSRMRAKKPKDDFFYNSGQMDLTLRYLLASDPGNRMAYEYLMANYLLKKDLDGFLEYIPLARKLGYNVLPGAWEETMAYIATRLPEDSPLPAGFSLSQDVIGRIESYAKLFSAEKQDTARIQKEFGKTYWYYLHFGK